MTDETAPSSGTPARDTAEATLFPKTAGERLREARVAQRLDLADIAQRTRIPSRHLQAIEDGDYAGLPTPTYAVGFAKAYARTVGLNEAEVAREVRGQAEASAAHRPEYQPYDTDEPARTPSGGVMLVAAVLAVLLLIGAGLWFGTTLFRGDGLDTQAPVASEGFSPEPAASPAAVAPAGAGQVTLVANDEVWLRVYDGSRTLVQKTFAAGERYDVPADAANPMINVGRADKLQVLLNGSAVAPLGDGRVAIKDVPIGAAALQARSSGQPAPAVQPTAQPTGRPSAAPTPTASRSVPAAFRVPAEPISAGQREAAPPAAAPPAAAPTTPAPGNSTAG